MLRMEMVTLDCRDPQQLALFWSRALNLTVLEDHGEFVVLGGDDGPNLGLQRVTEPRTGKNRMHLDLSGEPRADAARRLEALGATVHAEHAMAGGAWIVLSDPEGNEFCVGEHDPS